MIGPDFWHKPLTAGHEIKRKPHRVPINVKARLVLPLELWPERDRQLWTEGVQPVERLNLRRIHRHAHTLRPQSIENALKSYGRFLSVMHDAGKLVAEQSPAERVTPKTVALYFDALSARGNLDNSIKVRLMDLRVALRIMVPEVDFLWITRPGDRSLDSLLRQDIDDNIELPALAELVALARSKMDESDRADISTPAAWLRTCRHYRDGMIMGILAKRGPRLRSVAEMRVGINLYRIGDEWWIRLLERNVKNERLLEYALPFELNDSVTYYLQHIRPALLDPLKTDVLWGNGDGGAFRLRSIQTMINRESKKHFGRGFGTHLSRKVVATEASKRDPRNPGLAASILGISVTVTDTHYRKNRQETAALKFQKNLNEERREKRTIDRQSAGS